MKTNHFFINQKKKIILNRRNQINYVVELYHHENFLFIKFKLLTNPKARDLHGSSPCNSYIKFIL